MEIIKTGVNQLDEIACSTSLDVASCKVYLARFNLYMQRKQENHQLTRQGKPARDFTADESKMFRDAEKQVKKLRDLIVSGDISYNEILGPNVMDIVTDLYLIHIRPVAQNLLNGNSKAWVRAMTAYKASITQSLAEKWRTMQLSADRIKIAVDRLELFLSREDRPQVPLMCGQFIQDIVQQLESKKRGFSVVCSSLHSAPLDSLPRGSQTFRAPADSAPRNKLSWFPRGVVLYPAEG